MAGGFEDETMAGMRAMTTEDAETDSAIYSLLDNMGTKKFISLAKELEKLVNDSGYGELLIRVHDHRVLVIQVTKTIK